MTTLRRFKPSRFTCISNELAQNPHLSLKAKGLMLYFLSLPDDWKIHINHLVKNLKEGRDSILSTLKELKLAGYISHQKRSFEGSWEYFVSEEPLSEEQWKSSNNSYEQTGFPINGISQQLGNPQLQNTNKIKQKTNSNTKYPPSAEASDCTHYLIQKLKERLPQLKDPNVSKWIEDMDKLIRIDKRSKEQILEVIDFLQEDKWYRANILSPSNLRKHYDRIYANLESNRSPPSSATPPLKEHIQINVNLFDQIKAEIPEISMEYKKYGTKCIVSKNGTWDLSFDINPEIFKQAFYKHASLED